MGEKQAFAIFSPTMGTFKNIPTLLLTETVTPDNDKIVIVDGEIYRRPMRDYFLRDEDDDPVIIPDGYPAMLVVGYIKGSTNTLYLLVFTKAHIYYWDVDTKALVAKYTLASNATSWDYCFFNDKIIATPDSDYPLCWDATGNFTPLGSNYGIIAGYTTTSAITTVDENSAAEQKVLNVASTTSFTVGDTIIIDKGGDKEEIGKISSIQTGTSITLEEDLIYTHTQADADTVFICNCITKAKFCKEYENRLIIGYPYLDQDKKWYPSALYISALNDETNFIPPYGIGYFGIGQSGQIRGFGYYNAFLYIFKDKGRVQFFPVSSEEYFNFNEIPDNFGLLAMHSVVNDDKGNMYYLATDYTIKQEGLGTISQPIQTEILDKIQPDQKEKIYGTYVSDYKEIMWTLPIGSSENNYAITYKDGVWLLMKDVNITCFGEYYA